MFQNYQIEKYLGYNYLLLEHEYQVLIIDDNFSESIPAAASAAHAASAVSVATAVIEVYKKRQLDVPYNLYLLCRKVNERYGWSIESQIKYYSEYVKLFFQYKEEVLKYHQRYSRQKVFW